MLGAPALEAGRGLALEGDDGEIIARPQHLAEMVVAMDAYLQALRHLTRQGVDSRHHLLALCQHRTGPIAIRRRHLIQSGLEHSKRVARFVRRALAVGVDIAAGERLRSKGGIPREPCQSSMLSRG